MRPEAEGLTPPEIAKHSTGKGATIAIVDTGVNFEHPHLAPSVVGRGHGDFRDLHGHGTCCAALVHLLAPDAVLLAVRVTDARGAADKEGLASGISLAAEGGADIICVALGTELGPRAIVDEAVVRAVAAGAVVVAADPRSGRRVLPAQSPGAIGVGHRDGVDVALTVEGLVVAEGRARPSPAGPANFWGSSLSVARAAAALARQLEASGARGEALRLGFLKALSML